MLTAPPSTLVESPPQGFRSRPLITFVLLAGLCAAWLWLFRENSLEDAFITFRYARHLAEGFGYGAWNLDGTRVDGSTSFLWTLWVAIGFRLHVDPLVWTAASSYAALAALLGGLVFVAPSGGVVDHAAARRAGILIACYAPVHWYATSGMEAVAFMSLGGLVLVLSIAVGRRATLVFTGCSVLLALMRPEGIVVLAGAVAVALVASRERGNAWARLLPGVVAAAGATLALAAFRLYIFGDWLPNTYYAKAGGFSTHRVVLGLQYVWYFLQTSELWLVVVLAAILNIGARHLKGPEHSSLHALVVFLVVYGAYVVYVGGDELSAFPFWRHFVHVFPFIAVAVGLAIPLVVPSRSAVILTAVLAIAPSVLIFTVGEPVDGGHGLRVRIRQARVWQTSEQTYFGWVAGLSRRSTVIATSKAGKLPFTVDATFIDMLGLNDAHIAHEGTIDPVGPLDSKTDGAYVLRRSPDIIEGCMRASAIQTRNLAIVNRGRPKMIRELVENEVFQNGYCFAKTAPYHVTDRAVFLRIDFARMRGLDETQCLPVRSTALARPPIAATR
jgi:arabinofuranosyltransferase